MQKDGCEQLTIIIMMYHQAVVAAIAKSVQTIELVRAVRHQEAWATVVGYLGIVACGDLLIPPPPQGLS